MRSMQRYILTYYRRIKREPLIALSSLQGRGGGGGLSSASAIPPPRVVSGGEGIDIEVVNHFG